MCTQYPLPTIILHVGAGNPDTDHVLIANPILESPPVSEPVAAPAPVAALAPVAAPASESVAAPVLEPVAAPVLEPVAAPASESVAAPEAALEAVPRDDNIYNDTPEMQIVNTITLNHMYIITYYPIVI